MVNFISGDATQRQNPEDLDLTVLFLQFKTSKSR